MKLQKNIKNYSIWYLEDAAIILDKNNEVCIHEDNIPDGQDYVDRFIMEIDSIRENKRIDLPPIESLSHARVVGIVLRRYSFLAQLEHLFLPSLSNPHSVLVELSGQPCSQQRGQ